MQLEFYMFFVVVHSGFTVKHLWGSLLCVLRELGS